MAQNKPSPEMQRQIDENLKRVFQQTADEELPDRFKELLDKLKEQDANK
ncbi:NepR family anti-sigma factor [Falsihalocynthiibacter sp. SS001]